ncbi:hypothetical protein OG992_31790 [Micromonospora sp. NBC_00362]|uniref:hypothetical protein n=1 Tax=Micromonospora sp. NBC_00362 TaxID=2975975 RepID=UPI00224CED2C|nr:hypothetical protein [Micromonospora sp. NBC_00362]MCX5121759.1 hypothetical protein [Micromonospora sp. NBC_00362]
MSTDDFDLAIDPALDARLRGTLNAVAATITDASPVRPETKQHILAQSASVVRTRRDRRKRKRWLAIGLAAAVVPVAAFSTFAIDSGDVGRIPPKTAFVSGSEDGERYWLVPAVHKDVCGKTFGGVELAFERADAPGRGQANSGVAWGEAPKGGAPGTGCYVNDEARWLADPGRVAKLSQRLGGKDQNGDWITMIAVHPTVTTLRVTDDTNITRDVPTHARPDRPDGPRYAVFTTPARKPQVDLSVRLLTTTGQPATTEPFKIELPSR